MMRALIAIAAAVGLAPIVSSAQAAPGDLDRTFARGGVVKLRALGEVGAVAPVGDGVLVAGQDASDGGVVASVRADGSLQPSFGDEGLARVGVSGVRAAMTDAAGGVLVGGGSTDRMAIARLTAQGRVDPSFGTAGVARIETAGPARAMALGPDGSVTAVGDTPDSEDLTVVRLSAQGQPDLSFAGDGSTVVEGVGGDAVAVAVAADGSVLVGGSALARLAPDGERDPTFGGDGSLPVAGSLSTDRTRSILIPPVGDPLLGIESCQFRACVERISTTTPDGSAISVVAEGWGSLLAPGAQGEVFSAGLRAGGLPDSLSVSRLSAGAIDRGFARRGRARIYARSESIEPVGMAAPADGAGLYLAAQTAGERQPVLTRLTLAPGKADADADGVADKRDGCVYGFSSRNSGCPKARRSVRLRRSGPNRLTATVRTRQPSCLRTSVRLVERTRGGPDRVLDRRRVDPRTREARFKAPKGNVYATLGSQTTALARCSAARSGTLDAAGRWAAARTQRPTYEGSFSNDPNQPSRSSSIASEAAGESPTSPTEGSTSAASRGRSRKDSARWP